MSTAAEQSTVARPVSKKGVGLHTGEPSAVTLLPAEPNAGVVFVCGAGQTVSAVADYVTDTNRGITLGAGAAQARGVEHLLSALYGMGVDNVRVELEGPEVPACDGSAREWVELLRRAGRRRLGARRQVRSLREAVWVGQGEAWAVAMPASRGLGLAVRVDFGDRVVGRQAFWLRLTAARFARELAPARTFAFREELAELRSAGLARGGGEENAFAVGPEGYSGPLRFPDEVVRHKALDLVGDLALCGWRLQGQVTAVRPGHRLNVALARAVREALTR